MGNLHDFRGKCCSRKGSENDTYCADGGAMAVEDREFDLYGVEIRLVSPIQGKIVDI